MTSATTRFSPIARLMHWLMAPLVIAMLFIGIGMVSTLSWWHETLLTIHRPLGIAILVLVAVRLVVRITQGTPALPDDMPHWQQRLAHLSHWLFYALLFAMPLVGWAMLSAAGYPVQLAGSVHLPPILPQSVRAYAFLRSAHTVLALLLFATFLMHLAAALFHGLVRRDGVLSSMAGGGGDGA
ncbi:MULTISPECIES: cytochrome b/b6 domain-containing protein [unclassified Caballeronia]|uniref:cytochrome b n=1 Tax=unclassified Caballeronia TaxID=2646786 RepID=UPI0028675639|nr:MULTISPECIES: cytochrome b/b6 domain-containing protein [unclassified Caballeronia]MDR5752769.1 cytochrome b/b6 domain-containing protein [Caballeronia sp. LZ024]MDR5841411.1 cytochrome b/b6 domain-containing protein [Caballeronia sp. LZ031]